MFPPKITFYSYFDGSVECISHARFRFHYNRIRTSVVDDNDMDDDDVMDDDDNIMDDAVDDDDMDDDMVDADIYDDVDDDVDRSDLVQKSVKE